MLINLPTFDTIKRLIQNGKLLKINHYDLGDGVVHKIDEGRRIIFLVLEGDIYAFSDVADPEKAIHALRECAVFIVEPPAEEEESENEDN